MQTIETKAGQWLGDIAVRHAGSIEALFEIAVENNISITDPYFYAGMQLNIPTQLDKRVIKYFERNGIEPATKLIE